MSAVVDLSPLAGDWRKTNESPQWIDRIVVRIDGVNAVVRIFGSAPPSRPDWGEAAAEAIYTSATDASAATAFLARYAFDECDVDVEANANLGLLVVATFVRWHGGLYSDAFTREFFYRRDV